MNFRALRRRQPLPQRLNNTLFSLVFAESESLGIIGTCQRINSLILCPKAFPDLSRSTRSAAFSVWGGNLPEDSDSTLGNAVREYRLQARRERGDGNEEETCGCAPGRILLGTARVSVLGEGVCGCARE
ncbi:hypothetical protein MPLSOD_120060 [Mesorhizobium sp. SOD10]|nr:hypothetical protein MPLSOD_120060 [Mesorhizobium sp. SOD10]